MQVKIYTDGAAVEILTDQAAMEQFFSILTPKDSFTKENYQEGIGKLRTIEWN